MNPLIETASPEPVAPIAPAEIISADDWFEECKPSLAPALVEGVTIKGQPVYVARLTAAGLDAYGMEIDDTVPDIEARGAILAFALVRPNGVRIFDKLARSRLAQLPAEIAIPIIQKFREANGMTPKK